MTRRTAILTAAAAPCIALAIVSVRWSGLAGGGLWPPDEVTLSEAAATRNNAEALRLIRLGADPNRASRVRAGLLDAEDLMITPVEAAVGAQRADSLRMLLANGAAIDARELMVLRCFEQIRRDSAVRELLDARAGGPHDTLAPADCAGVRLPVARGTR